MAELVKVLDWAFKNGATGILAVVNAALCYAVFTLWKRNNELVGVVQEVQNQRIADAKDSTKTLLEVNTKIFQATSDLAKAADTTADTIDLLTERKTKH